MTAIIVDSEFKPAEMGKSYKTYLHSPVP